MSVEQLKARRERLDAAMAAARMRGDDLAAQQVDSTRVTRIAKDIAVFAATLRHGIDALNFTERQRLVRLLLERVVVAGDNLTIEHAIPLSGRFGGLRQAVDAAFRRAKAARLVHQHPELRGIVARGELHLTGLLMIAPYLGGPRH